MAEQLFGLIAGWWQARRERLAFEKAARMIERDIRGR